MKMQDLITLTENKLNYLNSLKVSAIQTGDVSQLIVLEYILLETEQTLQKLKKVDSE